MPSKFKNQKIDSTAGHETGRHVKQSWQIKVTAVNLDAKVMAVQQQEAGTLLILLDQKPTGIQS